jgi:imidazoleglycerol-phosphate dehydratase
VTIDGSGDSDSRTGVKFLDHMLDSFSTHSLVDIRVRAKGDLQHHLVEDVALTVGQTLNQALGTRSGIRRFGHAIIPMDDALALAAVDLVKRPYSSVQLGLERVMLEDAPREDLEHFFSSIATSLDSTIHVKVLDGKNDHHKFEAAMKAFALAFRDAATPDSRRSRTPSSKGKM